MRRIQVIVAGIKVSVPDNLLTLKDNGDYERFYNADMSLDTAKILEVTTAKQISDGEALVEYHVHEQIVIYNQANGVGFNSVDSCSKYVGQATYTHQPFCISILEFNTMCWVAARLAQTNGSVTLDTTAEEFIDMLPVFGV